MDILKHFEYNPIIDLTAAQIGINKWHWEFGDGTTSEEQNPIHEYVNGKGYYTSTVLTVEGPAGKSSMSKPWDVAIKNPKD